MPIRRAPLHTLTIREAGELLRTRQLSPVELTRALLARIDELQGTLQAYITVTPDSALAEARRAEGEIGRGAYRGPLHGIPIALKDLYDTSGVRTTAGSRLFADRVPIEDATAVVRLKAAGAIPLGKLAMHELGFGGTDAGSEFPVARNPWDLGRVPGGSSSGAAAAVAAALCLGSLGSCTGGSIRGPAACTGIVGMKPTYGRVSLYGVVPVSPTLDHGGPMTRTVEDNAIMLEVIAGHDSRDPASARTPVPAYRKTLANGVAGLRIGVPQHYLARGDRDVSPEVLALFDGALEILGAAGASIEDVSVPMLDAVSRAQQHIMLREAFLLHERSLWSRAQDFGEMARRRLEEGRRVTPDEYASAQGVREGLTRQLEDLLQRVDIIALPTMPTAAPRVEDAEAVRAAGGPNYTRAFNMTGMPAISIPCGFTRERLPVGIQFAGRPFEESTVLRAAHTLEQRLRLVELRPPI